MPTGCVSFITRSSDCYGLGFELEHRDAELAKVSQVSNHLDPGDLGVGEGEGEYPRQLAGRCEDQSNRSIDERWLYGSQPSRHRDKLDRNGTRLHSRH